MTRVYFIDDSETTIFIYKELIKRVSATKDVVAEYYSGSEEALSGMKKLEGDSAERVVVFLDIQMPSMDGFDFLELLEEEHEEIYYSLNVYMLTSSIMKRDREVAERFKVIKGFIDKPLLLPTLLDILAEPENTPGEEGILG